ncbi:MAG: serine/threonine-protein kinase [Bdellovibrionales bacterium]
MKQELEFLRKVGEGATAEVYEAMDSRFGRVAVKKFYPQYVSKEDSKKRAESEFVLLKNLDHKNIVKVFELSIDESDMLLKMEFVDGLDLSDFLLKSDYQTEEPLLWLLVNTARGLGAAHEQGIIHRDLKPENILVSKSGTVKVSDFGLSKGEDRSTLTKTGMLIGSLGYMAPEVVNGQPCSFRSDIFSFGAVAYEVLCGEPLFKGSSPQEIIKKICLNEQSVFPESKDYISKEIRDLVLSCIAKDPEDRPDSIYEVEAKIMSYLQQNKYLKGVKDSLKLSLIADSTRSLLTTKYTNLETISKSQMIEREELVRLAKTTAHFFPDSELMASSVNRLQKMSRENVGGLQKKHVLLGLFLVFAIGGTASVVVKSFNSKEPIVSSGDKPPSKDVVSELTSEAIEEIAVESAGQKTAEQEASRKPVSRANKVQSSNKKIIDRPVVSKIRKTISNKSSKKIVQSPIPKPAEKSMIAKPKKQLPTVGRISVEEKPLIPDYLPAKVPIVEDYGYLKIQVDDDVNVLINGEAIPRHFLKNFRIKAGDHTISLIKPGYSPIEANINVKANKESVINARRTL